MKRFILFAIFVLGLPLMTMAVTWRTDFEKAKVDAVTQHKLIMLKFSGSDWCVPCIKMERKLFSTAEFTAFADTNLVMVNADFPRLKKNQPDKAVAKANDALAAIYNKDGHFPLTLLLSPDGKILKSWEGYADTTPASFIDEINALKR